MMRRGAAVVLAAVLACGVFTHTPMQAQAVNVAQSDRVNVYDSFTTYGEGIDLNNGWKFHLGDLSGAEAYGYDDSSWMNVDLPHDYSISMPYSTQGEAESAYKVGETGLYRKTFRVGTQYADSRFVLHFDGSYMNTSVFVNGTQAGVNPYGYTMFSFDITDLLKIGEDNEILVRCNYKMPSSRWYSGAGIYRDVKLFVTPKTHIAEDTLRFTTPDLANGGSSAVTEFVVSNTLDEARDFEVKTLLYERNASTGEKGLLVGTNGESGTVGANSDYNIKETIHVSNPALWSPENPNLYIIRAELYLDGALQHTVEQEVGFRYFSFDANTGFSLNGVNTKLNGVCLHHDQGSLGSAAYADAVERQLVIMKDMGVNAVRVTHNPSSRVLRNAANRLGILLVEEAFDTWKYNKNGNTYDFAYWFGGRIGEVNAHMLHAEIGSSWEEYEVKQMVRAGLNDPSIIMWSMGNELMEGNSGDFSIYPGIMTRLAGYVDEIDGTRYVTFGDNFLKHGNGNSLNMARALSDKAGLQGVVGLNYTSDRRYFQNGERYDSFHRNNPGWIIYGSETGSSINSRGVYDTSKYQYQFSAYDNSKVSWGSFAADTIYDVARRDFVAGQFIWTGFDYLGEPTNYNGLGRGPAANTVWPSPKNSYFGIVDTAGLPKDSYYLYMSQWNHDVTTLHILPAWKGAMLTPDRNGNIQVDVYSNAPKVEVFVEPANGLPVSYGVKTMTKKVTNAGHVYYYSEDNKAGQEFKNLYRTWNIPFSYGTLRAVAYDENGNVISNTVGTSVRRSYDNAASLNATLYRNRVAADDHALNYITIDVLDAKGELVQNASNNVQITVDGPAELVGLDNGNSRDHQSYQDSNRNAFNGQMIAIVKMTGEEGRVTVNASSAGLNGASVSFDVVSTGREKLEIGMLDQDAAEIEEPSDLENVAPYAVSVSQSVASDLQSDNLASVNDGVQQSETHWGGTNAMVWTNYNAAQQGEREATVSFGFDEVMEVSEVVLYHFTDNHSADLPESIVFEAEGYTNTSFNALPVSEERVSNTTVKRVYRFDEPLSVINLGIRGQAKDGVRANSGAAYCFGFSEIEIYGKRMGALSYDVLPTSMVQELQVGSVENRDRCKIENAMDGDDTTQWHTSWDGCTDDARYITIVLNDAAIVNGYNYQPRLGSGDGDNNGRVADYRISVSTDGYEFTEVASGYWDDDSYLKEVRFDPVSAKYIRLEGVSTYGNSWQNKYMSAAEVSVTGAVR